MSENRKKKEKPKYNMWQNSIYMIKLAWVENEKMVLLLAALTVILSVANSIVNLYLTPTILAAVENKVPLGELVLTIFFLVGILMLISAALSYIGTNTMYGKIQLRTSIVKLNNRKSTITSYPNVFDDKYIKMYNKAGQATGGNSAATEAIWNTLTGLATNIIGFVIYLALLISVDPVMIVVVIATTIVSYFVNKRINEYEYRHRDELSEYENQIWYVSDKSADFSIAKDIRIFGMKPWLEEVGDKAVKSFNAFWKKAHGVYFWGRIVDLVLAFARNGVAYAYLITLALNDGLTASEFLLYFSAVGSFTGWVSGILGNFATLHRQSLDISTVREFHEYPELFKFEDGKPLEPYAEKEYELKLVNVSFSYPGSDKLILRDINLTLHPGEKIAVVGLNGAGKTTLVKILCGFYAPTEGIVLLNGKDIREYNRRDYYRMFSAVFQNLSILAGSIATNVAQSEDDIDYDRVKSCVAQAGLLEKIESLPAGFETMLNRSVYEDAMMLSGGETQRLMLARALYKNAPFLVLDEPTAALDPIAEAELYMKYNDMSSGKSSIYISHRLASTRFCDRIIFLENNQITEEGTHDELLKAGKRYAELFEVQSKYYRDEV